MNNLDSLTLKYFIDENTDFFTQAQIQKVQQPTRKELVLTLRNKGENKKFYINIEPEFYHVCFLSSELMQERNIVMKQTPPMFCMLLRKYIENARISKINLPKFERIIEIFIEYQDEFSEKTELCLAVELMGKYSNIILYNTNTNVIIGCAHNVSAEKSQQRELAGGLPYIYPTKQKKKDFSKISFDDFEKITGLDKSPVNISENFYYFSQALTKQLSTQSKSNLDLFNKMQNVLINICPCIKQDYSEFSLSELPSYTKFNNVSDMLEKFYTFNIRNKKIIALKKDIEKKLTTEKKKLINQKNKQQENINKIAKSVVYKEKADLIMSNLYQLDSFSSEITLKDYASDKETIIEMDTNKTAVQNANRYYKLYNKSKNAHKIASEMITETKNKIERIEDVLFSVNMATSIQDLNEISEELNLNKNEQKKKSEIKITTEIIDNFKIYIGKNNKQNDYIYSKISSPEDYWFHALNMPSAHILLEVKKGMVVPDAILLKCAEITKSYSSAKNSGKTAVIYTQRKNLRRPPNTPLGYVTYKNEKEIIV